MTPEKHFDLLIDKIENPLEFNILISLANSVNNLSTNEKITLDDELKTIGVTKGYFNTLNEVSGWYSLTEKGLKLREHSKGHENFEKKLNSKPLDWYKIIPIVLSLIFFGFNFYQKQNYDSLKSQYDSLKTQHNSSLEELSNMKLNVNKDNTLEIKELSDLQIDSIPQGKIDYELYFVEFDGRMENLTVEVFINGNTIKVYNNLQNPLSGGEILIEGVLLKHKSGKWIVGETKTDQNATEIGGCSGGPIPINFETKIIEWC